MNKDKEVEVVHSREAEVDLMEKVVELTILCRIKANLNGRVMIKERPNGKVVILIEEALLLTREEVILILEVEFMVIDLDVAKKGIDLLNVDPLKSGQNNRNVMIQEDIESSPSGPETGENLMVRRTLCNKGSDEEEPILRRSLFKTRCKMAENATK